MSDGRIFREQPGGPGSAAGKKLYWIWWLAGTFLQVLICLPWVWKRIHWRALAVTSAVFIPLALIIENLALHWRWWVWTEDKLLGPKVGLIPLEGFLIYFLVVPSLVTMQLLLQKAVTFWRGRR